ncbi:MAG TPA: alginate lyase family protein, partial [Myxococcaceae bacterium]|nr:alginate lyase family protein [Myxococcaceae bacterium]
MGNLSYYTARAKQLTPGGAAKVAARRAVRTAKQWLYRRGPGLDERDVLHAFGAWSLASNPRAWCDVSHREHTVAALFELPLAAERAYARAERALHRRYLVFEREVSFDAGAAIDWSRDPVSGHRWPLAPPAELELTPPGADPKYPWQLGRLEAVIALGQGYWLASAPEEKARFAGEFAALAMDFLRANPPNLGIQWACPMEVALRAANLAQALYMFRDAPEAQDPAFLLTVLRGLAEHAAFVEANLEDRGIVPNNHLIADHVGLLVVAVLFPKLPGAARQLAAAVRGLREQVPAQVFEDGVSFEGSTGYHRLVAELCVMAELFGPTHGVDLGATVAERTHGLLRASSAWCSERGLAPQIGDNDSGRALALADRPSLEHAYLATLGAVLFRDARLKSNGAELCDEAAWLYGSGGLHAFRALTAQAEPSSFTSPQGGIHVLRGAGAVVTAVAGPQGQRGAGGHSHNDKLSFELHLDGEPVIVDPGSPVYARDPAQRNAYRSTAAHNCVEVDGEEQAEIDPSRLFALPEGAYARVDRFETSPELDILEGSHSGYRRLGAGLLVRRALTLDKRSRALRVHDTVEGEGMRTLRIHLQLPDCLVQLRGPRGEERHRAIELIRGAPIDETVAIELGPR